MFNKHIINKGGKTPPTSNRNGVYSLFLICMFLQSAASFLENEIGGDVRRIWSVAGKRAELPCQTNPRTAQDRPLLVLWYRQSMNKPVYSYDARSGNFSSGDRWHNRTLFGERAYFVPLSKPPALVLEPVMPHDEDLYTCRIDYHDSPTTSSFTHLSVIIFPDPPEILWKGHQVFGPIGPLKEGSFHKLTCITRGGRPLPSLVWWLEGHRAMDQVQEKGAGDEMRSILTVRASRDINMKSLSCHAQIRWENEPLAQPLAASVLLNVSLPPIGIEIKGGEHLVSVDTTLSLVCLTWGSHPPAQITWWRAGKKIKSYSHHIKDGGNLTTSEIKIVVDAMDHGSTFTCRASNQAAGGLPLIAARRLNVTYKPSVELRVKVSNKFISKSKIISAKLRSITVKQGSNVQLECSSDANPVPNFIEWHQNGVIIDAGKEAWSLLLQRVTKEKSGFYSCAATNSAGRGTSVAYNIVVEHPPQCSTGWLKRTQGTEIGRSVTVLCRVEALPFNDISFSWSKISKDGSEVAFSDSQIQTDGTTSRLFFTPNSLTDFGTLVCKAKNSVGLQERPCQVTLVPASSPDPPFNCTTDTKNKAGSLSVACLEGFDGGFPQKFILVAIQKGKVCANITRDFPEWSLQTLEYGKPVTLRVYAYNTRGRSESVRLEVFIPIPEIMSDQDVKGADGNSFSGDQGITLPIIGILIGAGGALVVAIIVILVFSCSSPRKRLFCLSKMSPRPSADERYPPHTFVISPPPIFNQRANSAASLSHSGMTPDPDIVTCLPYGSETSSKGLDDISPDQQMLHPLMAYNQPNFGTRHLSSVPRIPNQEVDRNNCDCFERPDIKKSVFNSNVSSREESERVLTEASWLLEKDPLSSKGAIPKRILTEDEYSFISHSKENVAGDDLSNQKDAIRNASPSNISNSLYSNQSSLDLRPRCDHCFNYDVDFQRHHTRFLNNRSTDSLTYSNACCLEHYGPYYVYKHVKCYPHKNYRPYEEFDINPEHSNPMFGYVPSRTPFAETKLSTSDKGSMDEILKVADNQVKENFYEEAKKSQINESDGNIDSQESKCWNTDFGSVICGGGKIHTKERKKAKRKNSPSNDGRFSTYKNFDPICSNESSLNRVAMRNNEIQLSKSSIPKEPGDPIKLTKNRKARVLPPAEENLKITRIRTAGRVQSSPKFSKASSKYPVYEPSFQVMRDQKELDKLKYEKFLTKSSLRLKEVGNTQLYKKREHQKLQHFGKRPYIERNLSAVNEQLKRVKKHQEDIKENNQVISVSEDFKSNERNEKIPILKGSSSDLALHQTKQVLQVISQPQLLLSTDRKTQEDPTSSVKEDRQASSRDEDFPKRSPKPSKTVTVSKSEVQMQPESRASPRSIRAQGQSLPLKSILRSKTSQ